MNETARHGGLSEAELDIMRSVEDDHWWYRALRGHILDCIAPSPKIFPLLDAGCGSGGMLARIRENFPCAALTGLDLNEHALALTAAREIEAKLVRGSVDQMPFDDAVFEIVLSLDVIYHRDVNERPALREMQRVLQPGGRLLINVPAFDFLRGRHDVAVNTARRYTRARLHALLIESGFTIDKMTYWNMTLMPAVTGVRWLSRRAAKGTGARSDLAPPSPFANIILGAITRTEFALSRSISLPVGTSLFAIAHK